MKRYMIERDIQGVGDMSVVELCGASWASNQAIQQIGQSIQGQHSYVAGNKTFASIWRRMRRQFTSIPS